jgi:nucleoside-diphosphate-sugar epimerase
MNRDSQSVPEAENISKAQTVFITGGSGFVGRSVVRALIDHGHSVRVLARRMPEGLDSSVRVVLGDLTQPESFAPALEGVSTVVHAALTDGLSKDVQATSKLHQLSAQSGVRQFLHLSTISVYGGPAAGAITEDTPPIRSTDPYASTKLAIEEALRASSPACPEVAILRLGCVYGPGGGWWTEGLLNMMARGRSILVDGGTGYANLIHVEDVGAMVLLLLARSNPPWEIYNVTDGEPVEWSRYFAELEKILGRSATISMSSAEAREFGRKWLRPSLPRRVLRKLTGRPNILALDDQGIDGYASHAVFSNEKAVRLLGFRAAYDFESGLRSIGTQRNSSASELANPAPARTS